MPLSSICIIDPLYPSTKSFIHLPVTVILERFNTNGILACQYIIFNLIPLGSDLYFSFGMDFLLSLSQLGDCSQQDFLLDARSICLIIKPGLVPFIIMLIIWLIYLVRLLISLTLLMNDTLVFMVYGLWRWNYGLGRGSFPLVPLPYWPTHWLLSYFLFLCDKI